jgi:hypothetical protein
MERRRLAWQPAIGQESGKMKSAASDKLETINGRYG